ncbi:Lrp/AsnC family transcriptional regulator [Spartinivicinus poritis]|uniref:siroheme decarboxylase n=1 Tax=Spartinivicinus poritis TaxID=2994640 RepID=A0ABT5U4H8_9GAMM|nr:Lrp/AsnC family transcriptional regulator [Spartinivicinus sp. A2-2]MDE1461130.1 Lrp/AsnC family transcriptional regulator [Spartinivicinus sp. A2-2]
MDNVDRQLLNRLQTGIPICEHPFQVIANELSCTEQQVIDKLQKMLDSGLLTRFGPLFDINQFGGAFTLAAMQVPNEDFDRVTDIVNHFPQVAHNYQRQHQLNMWFVIATEQTDEIVDVITQIESLTGLCVYNMPKQEEFYVGLYLPV